MLVYSAKPCKLDDGTWGAAIPRDQINIPDEQIGKVNDGFLGAAVDVHARDGRKFAKRIKAVEAQSEQNVFCRVEPRDGNADQADDPPDDNNPQPDDTGRGTPGDDDLYVTKGNLTKWFHGLMAELRKRNVDVGPIKDAMGAVEIEWEEFD